MARRAGQIGTGQIRTGQGFWALAALALLVAVSGCQIGQTTRLEPVGEANVDVQHAACLRKGGDFRKTGEYMKAGDHRTARGGFFCLETTADDGKSCTRASQCESACLARSQSCAPLKPLFGCNEVLTETGIRVTQCLE